MSFASSAQKPSRSAMERRWKSRYVAMLFSLPLTGLLDEAYGTNLVTPIGRCNGERRLDAEGPGADDLQLRVGLPLPVQLAAYERKLPRRGRHADRQGSFRQ